MDADRRLRHALFVRLREKGSRDRRRDSNKLAENGLSLGPESLARGVTALFQPLLGPLLEIHSAGRGWFWNGSRTTLLG